MSWLFQPLLPGGGHQQAAVGGTDDLLKADLVVGSPALGSPNLINTKATGLTVSSPALGTPSLVNTVPVGKAVGSPVLGAPSLICAVPAGNTVGSPVLGAPALALTHILSATSLTVSPLAIGAPSLVNTVPLGLASSSPVLGTPALTQNQLLSAAPGFATGPPALGAPNIVNTVPAGLAVSSPALGAPALTITITLSATSLAVSPLALGTPNLINTKAVTLAVGSPALGAPSLTNTVPLGLTVGSPVLPGLRLGYVLAPLSLAPSSPVLGAPNVVNTVPAGKTVSSPVLGTPLLLVNAKLLLGDRALDRGLDAFDSECDRIYVCSTQPTTFAEVSTYAIGYKHWGVGLSFVAEAPGSPDGRKVVSNVIVDGSITANGPVSAWAAVDTINSRFLASGPLTGGKLVSAGMSFTLEAIPIHLRSA